MHFDLGTYHGKSQLKQLPNSFSTIGSSQTDLTPTNLLAAPFLAT